MSQITSSQSGTVPTFYKSVPTDYRGLAKMIAASERVYEGIFEKGKMIEGSITFIDGNVFRGKFNNSIPYGECSVTFPNGISFKGHVNNWEYVGPIIYNNGAIYEGKMHNFQMSCYGKLKMAQGTYEGHFREGLFDGQGKLVLTSGGIYEGIFDKGELVNGTILFSDGRVYTGELLHGQFHGNGELNCDGAKIDIYRGAFSNGKFIKGFISCKDGSTYDGEVENSQPHGEGRLVLANRISFTGTFQHGNPYTGVYMDTAHSTIWFLENGQHFDKQTLK